MTPVEDAFCRQASICRSFDAPFCAELLERCAKDLGAGGPVARVLQDWPGDPVRQALPLRLLAGVHDLVLAGELSGLREHYPTTGGTPRIEQAWPLFREVVAEREVALQPWLAGPPQTNEVHRCVPLLGGFLEIAARERRPLRILELGSSAGLNLRFDRYAYRLGEHCFGPPDAGVRLAARWEGPPPPLAAPLEVVDRRGCDRQPLWPGRAEDCRRLQAWIWADHRDRMHVLRAALQDAAADPAAVDEAGAADWLAERLSEPMAGAVDVVFHTIVWSYLSDRDQDRVRSLLEDHGRRRPLHWLRLEDAAENLPGLARSVGLYLTSWPGGRQRRLALCQAHGRRVRWEG